MDPNKWQLLRSPGGRKNHQVDGRNYGNNSNSSGWRSSRAKPQSFTWKKNFYRSTFQGRKKSMIEKNITSFNKSKTSVEDAEEEERKRKLSDAANKLLDKIKSWSAEKNASEDSNKQQNISKQNQDLNHRVESSSCETNSVAENNRERIAGESEEVRPKRIAHSKVKEKVVKTQSPKIIKNCNKTDKYDVNKETVKDFQSRIQHKLINEIMQMPKENLQNVLNDPKINPIMELKMSRLVKENKFLIAQRLRALAESKIKGSDSTGNPQLLVDIDKLIDPVIETDLSVLPYELIKQMENIFQVQFDYSDNKHNLELNLTNPSSEAPSNCEVPVNTLENSLVNNFTAEDILLTTEDLVILENSFNGEDLNVYECSTDEDEEVTEQKFSSPNEGNKSPTGNKRKPEPTTSVDEGESSQQNKKQKLNENSDSSRALQETEKNEVWVSPQPLIRVRELPSEDVSDRLLTDFGNAAGAQKSVECQMESTSKSCQTYVYKKTKATQTSCQLEESEVLYGVPVPKLTTDNNFMSLCQEVTSIQNLINKLNERRFHIFVQLTRANPTGAFLYDNLTNNNLIETIANGSLYISDFLRQPQYTNQSKKFRNSKKWKKKRNNQGS